MDHETPVRLGIIGLGKLWETRHRPALERMRDRFRVVTVYDQVLERARRTAAQMRCRHSESIAGLMDPHAIDAVCLMAPQWFGTFPIEICAKLHLPIYCSVPIVNLSDAERIQSLVTDQGLQFLPEMARRHYPATKRLRELIETRLGPVRMILGQTRVAAFDRYGQPGPTSQNAPVSLKVDPIYFLLDWARHVIGEDPSSIVQAEAAIAPQLETSAPECDFHTMILRFPKGAVAQLTCYRHQQSVWGDATRIPPGPGYQIFCERGMAFLEMPDFIRWHDSTGYHEERLPMSPSVGEILNDQFYQLVRGQNPDCPNIDDVLATARMLSRMN
jgi:predicted dehydrogenase